MSAVSKPMGRVKRSLAPARGSEGSDLDHNLARNYRAIVGSYVRQLRVDAGLTQEELGKVFGVGNTYISSLEHGYTSLPPEWYATIVSHFGLDARAFGEFMLRYTNPWLCALIIGVEADPSLKRDVKLPVPRLGSRVGSRAN